MEAMSAINDGGPIAASLVQSVPVGEGFHQVTNLQSVGGLTIRDWFAGMALQGWLSSFGSSAIHPVNRDTEHDVAKESYRMADAMIAARAGKESE
jgi:hypothetical protein